MSTGKVKGDPTDAAAPPAKKPVKSVNPLKVSSVAWAGMATTADSRGSHFNILDMIFLP